MKILPSLIKEDVIGSTARLVPRMHQTLLHGTTEYNMAACEAVRTVANENLLSPENFTKVFLPHILNSLESRDTVAADEYLNVLLEVIQVLPQNVLLSEVLPVAVNKAHISKPVQVRITSCKILGRLALTFSAFLVKRDINPVVISLCQDVSGEVRAAMSAELPNISATLGVETGVYLLNHILDLYSDEDPIVREVSIEAVAQMLPRFTPEVLKSTIIPLTKKIFPELMKNEDRILVVLSRFYGQYAIGLKNAMTPPEKVQFLMRYIQLAQLKSNVRRKLNPYKPMVVDDDEAALHMTKCRLNCAYNLPAMVVFTSDLKQDSIDSLFTVFKSLATDSFCQVRRKIAAGFHEVMKLMPKWHANMRAELIKLLQDDVDLVLEGLVPNISNILLNFAASRTLTADRTDSGKDIGQALLVCENNLCEKNSLHWRLHEELLRSFKTVPKVFHPEFVYLTFVPLLIDRATNGRILPCRVAALEALLVIISDPSQSKQKLKIRNKILDLCNNSSFHCRMIFLQGMLILVNSSPETLKELFFQNITSMAEDKVANIRLMVCKLLPKLKTLALDPLDPKLLASINACVASLSAEKDRDVTAQLKQALQLMEDLDINKGIRKINVQDSSTTKEHPSKYKTPQTSTETKSVSESRSKTLSYHSGTPRQSSQTTTGSGTSGRMNPHSLVSTTMMEGRSSTVQRSIPGQRNLQTPSSSVTHLQRPRLDSDSKRSTPVPRLTPDEFLIDAGIPLKSTQTQTKRIQSPRPIHRPILPLDEEMESEHQISVESKENIKTLSRPARNINRLSNLPIKKTICKQTNHEEIEKETIKTETVHVQPQSPRFNERLRYSTKPTSALKENKRHSVDVSNMSHTYTKMETRSVATNKRYSLTVDATKSTESKKSLTLINNNTLRSPKLELSRPNTVRPQSCVLQVEKVNNAKRSMSVENLPPKVTRLASRLPVRANDPKPVKPK